MGFWDFLDETLLWVPDEDSAKSSQEWEDWYAATKKSHPIKYFFKFVVRDVWLMPIYWKFDSKWRTFISYMPHKRIVWLKDAPLGYRDAEATIFYSTFQTLVDYVEIYSSARNMEWWEEKLPNVPEHIVTKIRWNTRCAEAGFDFIRRCRPQHGGVPSKVFELYNWYKFDRPKRMDPWKDQKIWKYDDSDPTDLKGITQASPETRQCGDWANDMDNFYLSEDAAMLKILISIHDELW